MPTSIRARAAHPGARVLATYADSMPPAHQSLHHDDLLDSEPRIASYVGIVRGQVPAGHLLGRGALRPPTQAPSIPT